MHLSLKSALATLALAALAPAAHAQGLTGQPVTVTVLFPTNSTVYGNLGTKTVTPAGTAFPDTTIGSELILTVTPTQITFTFAATDNFASVPFNGYQIAETGGSPTTITGVTLNPSSNFTGFDASRISFDATDVFANFQGLPFTSRKNVTLDLQTAPFAAVPEPSTVASLGAGGLGVLGLVLRARKRKKAVAS